MKEQIDSSNATSSLTVRTNTVCRGCGSGESRTEVLKEVNFEARPGELLMLVGPSGCGKTTLLSVIVAAPEELEFLPGSKSPMDLSLMYPTNPKQLPMELAGVDWPPKP